MPFTIHADPHTQDCRRRVWGFFYLDDRNKFTAYLLVYIISILWIFQQIGVDSFRDLEVQ